jgi:hypothetical protein
MPTWLIKPLIYLGMAAALYGAGRFHQYRSDLKDQAEAKLTESESARLRERAAQVTHQRIADEKEAATRRLAADHVAALASLRNRPPSRLPAAASPACNGASPASLATEDAAVAVGFAVEFDQLREDYAACLQHLQPVTP